MATGEPRIMLTMQDNYSLLDNTTSIRGGQRICQR